MSEFPCWECGGNTQHLPSCAVQRGGRGPLPVEPHPIEVLYARVREMHDRGALHRKRGFSLADSNELLATNHLMEEVVELQAEACISRDQARLISEAADVFAIFMHLLVIAKVTPAQLLAVCSAQLDANFTYNPEEVLTQNPGFTRGNRVSS